MTTLTEFLLARIAEDEAEIGHPFGRDEKSGPNGIGWAEVGAISEVLMCGHVRAMAECEAKRRIVAAHSPREFFHPGGSQIMCALDSDDVPCFTLRTLAAVYSGHPDYRDEWRMSLGSPASSVND